MTSEDSLPPRLIPSWFGDIADAIPHETAIAFEDSQLSYGALNRLSAHLAGELMDKGAGFGTVIGLCVPPSLELVVGALAILRAGCIYLPLDPGYPPERLDYMIADSGCRLIIATSALDARSLSTRALVHQIDGYSGRSREYVGVPLIEPQALFPEVAYIVYTSGSTGRPKGVEGTHRSLANRMEWGLNTFPYAPGEICCLKTSISFVDSLSEMFAPLLGGCKLVITPAGMLRDPAAFVDFLVKQSVSRLVAVPSLLGLICAVLTERRRSLHCMKVVVSSGEPLSAQLAGEVLARMPHARLVNLYGSSEIGGDVTSNVVTRPPDTDGIISIGWPISNTICLVMDEQGRPVPDGVIGELYVGGAGVARGYLNRPQETAARFIEHSLGDRTRGHLYRTGDLVRRMPNGSFAYHGRLDHQVKIGGVRVEIGEVEHALTAQSGVREAAVAAHRRGSGESYLVAHVVLDAASDAEAVRTAPVRLRKSLLVRLPQVMIPAHIEIVAALPLTPSGKLDRQALRLRIATAAQARQTPALSEVQQSLRAIWSEVLEVPPEAIDVDADFHALGGNSFALLKLVFRISRQWNHPLDVQAFLKEPTLARLARAIELGEQRVKSVSGSGPTEIPLTPSQLRLLEGIDIDHPRIRHHNIEFLLQVESETAAVSGALERCLARHDVFCITSFGTRADGRLVQIIGAAPVRLPTDRTGVDRNLADFIAEAKTRRNAIRPAQGQLYYFFLYADADGTTYVYALINHLIFDGYSHYVLLSELARFLGDPKVALSAPLSFARRSVAYSGDAMRRQLESELPYWEATIAEKPDRTLFADAEGGASRVVTIAHVFHNGWNTLQRRNERSRSTVFLAACVFAVAARYGLNRVHARIVGSGRMAVAGIDDSLTVGYVSDHYPQVFEVGLDAAETLAKIADARLILPRGGAGYPWLRHCFQHERLLTGAQIDDFPLHFNYMPRSDQIAGIRDRSDLLGEPDRFLGDEDYAGIAFFVVEEEHQARVGLYRNSRYVGDETASAILDLVIESLEALAGEEAGAEP